MRQGFTIAGMMLLFCVVGSEDSFAQKSGCALKAADSVYLADGPVYRDCDVDKKARAQMMPRFDPPLGRPNKMCMSAEFEFVVDTIGRPEYETVRLVRTNDDPFAQAARYTIEGMVFQPARKDGKKVRQIYVFKSAMTLQVPGTRIRPNC